MRGYGVLRTGKPNHNCSGATKLESWKAGISVVWTFAEYTGAIRELHAFLKRASTAGGHALMLVPGADLPLTKRH